MKANRPHRVTFQQKRRPQVDNLDGAPTLDGYGGEVESWVDVFDEYAAIYYGTGTEQRNAAQTQGEQAATFEVLSNQRTRDLTVSNYRILHGGGVWNIRSLADIGFNEGRKINAVRSVE